MGLRVTEDEFQAFLRKQGKLTASIVVEPPKKRSKYGNTRLEIDGAVFHSKGEYARYNELLLQEKAGLITDLKRQVEMPIVVNGIHICGYRADFVYVKEGVEVVEDFKGVRTDIYLLKKKLVAACYGKEILETTSRK